MITVDDSGSMQVNYIPEGVTTVNGYTVTFPSQYTSPAWQYFMDLHLSDPTHQAYLGSGVAGYAVVPALKGDPNVFQRQMRAAAVNRLYYDPAVRYQPWLQPNGTRFANALPTAARWDPVLTFPTNTVDLTFNLTGSYWGGNAPSRHWCVAFNVCEFAQRDWYPGLYYVLRPGANPHLATSYEEYDINDLNAHSPALKNAARTDCAARQCTQAEERQNFANWFQFYRSRLLLTKASVSEVVGGATPATAPRFGTASVNSGPQPVDGLATTVVRKGVREFSDAHRAAVLTDIQSLQAASGSPLKLAMLRVGSYFTFAEDNGAAIGARSTGSPWRTDPSAAHPSAYSEALSCRRSYNILMTDGYDNGDVAINVGNVDGNDGPAQALEPDMQARHPKLVDRYVARPPFSDGFSNTLADYASYFYVRDLATTVPNKVAPLTGDLADPHSWQHLGQFTVGLGVSGQLPANTAAERQDTLARLRSGSLSWPNPGSGGDTILAEKIDDLFHAAVNTGGEFFRASNSHELTSALKQAIGRASASARVDAGIAGSGAVAQSGLLKFVPSYQSSVWSGDLTAYAMASDGMGGWVFRSGDQYTWKASEVRPAWEARTMLTWDPGSSAAVRFDASMPTALKARIAGSERAEAIIDYLRGDTREEGVTSDKLRPREGAQFPDFVNAPPVYVKNLVNLGYTWEGYAQHLVQKSARDGMVYLGGGGGFLHGFDAATGVERLAYMPKGVQRKAAVLADPHYGTAIQPHQYFVDGAMLESDAQFAGRWRNVLIGTLGSGGRGVYALDVTHPAELSVPATATNAVLWDFSEEDDPDLGYIHTAPEVGRIQGKWYAFFGNGSHSPAGHAVLFAVDLESRRLHKRVLDPSGGNGLTGVRVLRNAGRELLALYGVDLTGQVWRIDFDDKADPAAWRIGFGGVPLFQAKSAAGRPQPITVKPSVAPHYLGGQVIVFGTGKLLDDPDRHNTDMQSLYGVWDRSAGVSSGTQAPWASLSNQRSDLLQQLITTTPVQVTQADGSQRRFFQTSSYKVNWDTQRGWYMDLTLPGGRAGEPTAGGQRVIHSADVVDEFAFFQTVLPGADPAPCESSAGQSHHFVFLAISGEVYERPVLDINGDGLVDQRDRLSHAPDGASEDKSPWAAGYESAAEGAQFVTRIIGRGAPGEAGGLASSSTGAMYWRTYCANLNCKISDRVWKQIISPPQPQ
ncbi:pilus assembly protein [Ideonella paludis]|uniref:PilY1 beta-propeller domain-containing protein n=1 Tax=Ideonella paludis TaxID=1233411 RepID=A0ABS5E2I7_9BURK|nr:PilC/PilY family type IV pilus protein [Ideonella paludis]MBQ0937630.1 hypothetical protein [Ideonella paludis]